MNIQQGQKYDVMEVVVKSQDTGRGVRCEKGEGRRVIKGEIARVRTVRSSQKRYMSYMSETS
jgi:hypothetical protein